MAGLRWGYLGGELAVDLKIAQQRDFVAWWDAELGSHHGDDRSKNAERGSWSVAAAVTQAGIDQVSRWPTSLHDADAYREDIIISAEERGPVEGRSDDRSPSQQDSISLYT